MKKTKLKKTLDKLDKERKKKKPKTDMYGCTYVRDRGRNK